ncbi:diguanylate cyclase [Campylobacter sputorum]|uniref:diguanylate cyclase n=1 Tax=Campylobacter sputorum TaxID=206 RepID=UPI001243D80C|nr:diguanylate cyclase [Campylobacter sputorum]KAB0580751.1 diguanylate cyclase [Campylobacter sputorum subsp. sputorum]
MVKLDNTTSKVDDDIGVESDNIHSFSKNVLDKLTKENIPPTPENFEIYFNQMLDEKPENFKKQMSEFLDFDTMDSNNARIIMENDIKQVFVKIKSMLQAVAVIYKNFSILKNIISKKLSEIETNTNPLAVKNLLLTLDDSIGKLDILLEKHMNILKDGYEEVIKKHRSLEGQSVYDSKFEVFNKNYFTKILETEIGNIRKYKFTSSMVMVKISDKILDKIPSLKEKESIVRNAGKILVQSSRRSDVIAYYEKETFAILLKHTELKSAIQACDSISKLLSSTITFINNMEINILTEISVLSLDVSKTAKENIDILLNGIKECIKENSLYFVIQPDNDNSSQNDPDILEQE